MQQPIGNTDHRPVLNKNLIQPSGGMSFSMATIGVALTPICAAGIFWFLFNLLLWRMLY